MTKTENLHFEAEVDQLLQLMIHSLYKHRDIFLRELISNASDALDKLRFRALTEPELLESADELGIHLESDPAERTLCVRDNGIGMDRDDLIRNLGTLASSGTKRFLERAAEAKGEGIPELIGQFGVGFYASFMVAAEVVVETRPVGKEEGWRWSSAGDGTYKIEPASGLVTGTSVKLHLRDDLADSEDYLTPHALREVVRRYSDFVEYPVRMEVEHEHMPTDDEGKPVEGAEKETVVELETFNSMKPLWSRDASSIEPSEYAEFYRHLTGDWAPPAKEIHFKAEGATEYTALLYLPSERPFDLLDGSRSKSRISLYVRRVFIMEDCEELMPVWLRFVRGLVESSDLPLNVSRETLQNEPRLERIQKRLVKKVLVTLKSMLADDREDYERFWKAFGIVLKEGIHYGADDEQRISSLCLFESSRGEELTTLAEYIERMPSDQKAIYTVLSSDRKTAEASPHLEALLARGCEVLLLTDPVDEWLLARLSEFDGKPLESVERGNLEVDESEKRAAEERTSECEGLLARMGEVLEDDIKEVRFSTRLRDSAAVLVTDEGAMSPQMERMMRQMNQEVPKAKRILELNPSHALVERLEALFEADPNGEKLEGYTELLMGQALLGEGSSLKDPARFSKLVADLMVEAS